MLSSADAGPVADEYGLGPGAAMWGPVARGELGQIWRLESSRGAFAVKEWLEEFPWDELEEGAAFQEAASARGVPAPPVLRRRDGSLLLDLHGTTAAVYGWVDVNGPDTALDAAAVGSLLAALHRVPFDGRIPSDPWYTDPVGADRWDELIATLHSRRARFTELLAGYRDELVALESLMAPPGALRACHRDLWADNLRATPAGGLCLIDWDNAGLADPNGEVALTLFEFCRGDPARARDLCAAYLEGGGPGRVRTPADFTMPIAQLSHIGERACRLWLEAEDDAARDHAASLVEEFAGDPLTGELIDDLLEAARPG
jgi:Ser/Thr protein kinase RdoA (MazF antagonist)